MYCKIQTHRPKTALGEFVLYYYDSKSDKDDCSYYERLYIYIYIYHNTNTPL